MAKQKTYFAKQEPELKWFSVDADGKTLGRLATRIATVLMGKHKPTYTPHMDMGDGVIVTNVDKLLCSTTDKTYYWHTGYPGGIKKESITDRMLNCPERVLFDAVRRMLPKGPLGRKMLRKLKAYAGDAHNHMAQQPAVLEDK